MSELESTLTVGIALMLVALACCVGCKAKASVSQCDQLLDRYALLVVSERTADASAEQIKKAADLLVEADWLRAPAKTVFGQPRSRVAYPVNPRLWGR